MFPRFASVNHSNVFSAYAVENCDFTLQSLSFKRKNFLDLLSFELRTRIKLSKLVSSMTNSVLLVFLRGGPSEMVRIAARSIVARMSGLVSGGRLRPMLGLAREDVGGSSTPVVCNRRIAIGSGLKRPDKTLFAIKIPYISVKVGGQMPIGQFERDPIVSMGFPAHVVLTTKPASLGRTAASFRNARHKDPSSRVSWPIAMGAA